MLPFIHRAVHALHEQIHRRHVCARSDKLVRLVHIAVKIAPDKRRLAVDFASAKFELFTNQEDLLVICVAYESVVVRRGTRIYTRIMTAMT